MGKLMMVGFFSSVQLFLEKRCMIRIRYGGSFLIRYERCTALRVSTWTLWPSNWLSSVASGTCGMMLRSSSSLNSGGGGRFSTRNRYGVTSFVGASARASGRAQGRAGTG